MFYISAYFEANRDEYYERLTAASRDGDWTGWCLFFLKAIQNQAEENQRKASEILNLYAELKPKIAELTRSQYANHALDWMFAHPIFRSADFIKSAGIPKATANRILAILKNESVIGEMESGSGRRATVYAF